MESFAAVADLWLADVARTRRQKTLQNYAGTVQMLLRWRPELRERALTRRDLLEYREHRVDATSAWTANRELKAVKACLRWAWLNELEHPRVELAKLLLPPPERRDETLSPGEVQRLFDAAAFDLPVLALLKVCHGTGLRLGEA